MKSGSKEIIDSRALIATKGQSLKYHIPPPNGNFSVELNVTWDPPENEKNSIKWDFQNEKKTLFVSLNGPISGILASTSAPCSFAELSGMPLKFVMTYIGTQDFCSVHIQIEKGE